VLVCSLINAKAGSTQLFKVRGDGRMFVEAGGFEVTGDSLMNGNLAVGWCGRFPFNQRSESIRFCAFPVG
jgi:hypothetical protein